MNPIKFIKTNSEQWKKINQDDQLNNIVFIEDIKQIWTNGVYYGSQTNKIKTVTLNELQDLKNTNQLIPGQIYEITDFRTTLDESVGEVVYKDGETHHIQVVALNSGTLSEDAKSIQMIPGNLPPTGDFELIAYKCDWDPDKECYGEDEEYYKYVGETIEIDDTIYYIWNKYEKGARLSRDCGKSRVLTDTLDINCSIDNPYHIEYYISYEDEINPNYEFMQPTEDENDPAITDSFSRIIRIDKPVYCYNIKMQACDMDPNTGEYGLDEDSWYEYNGDTIDIDGVTYFIWNKYSSTDNGDIARAGLPLTTSLDIQCSPSAPYTPEYWLSVDTGELDDEYFDPEKTDIFYQIEYSNLPEGLDEIKSVFVETSVKFNLSPKSNFDESQIVHAIALKTKFDTNGITAYSYPDYESLYLYHGETMDINGDSYRVWDKYSNDTGEGFISVDYRRENGYYWAQILTEKLYIDCSLKKPCVQDYVIQEGDTIEGYELNNDRIIDIHYFNNVTNYIRFKNNGWYVRCPELDRDGKFGWGYITYGIISEDGYSYDWGCGSEDNPAGPIPPFVNKYYFEDEDFFLTDTLDPQIGDSFYHCGSEDNALDTIDKVWGTIIKPEISYKGIYYMKDEFGNEAPYDFKHIKFSNLYTFGNEEEDYSLNGFENGVYNNVIMKPIDGNYNRMNISSKNTYGNTFYPSCIDCVIDFSIQESIITKSDRGLHPFCPTNFVEPVVVKDMLNPLKVITYTTIDEQVINPKQDAFGNVNIITNKYE